MQLRAIHTPGHTDESMCYLLLGEVLFTGDTLFPTGVGRPALDASPEEARARAEALYHRLHKLLALPGPTLLLAGPTRTPVPFAWVPVLKTLSAAAHQRPLRHAIRPH